MSWSTKDIGISKLMRVEGDLVVDQYVVFPPVSPPPEPKTSTTSEEITSTLDTYNPSPNARNY